MSVANARAADSSSDTDRAAARALGYLRGRLARNHFRALISGSRLRLAMILICSAVFWCGLFGLFFEGFHFLGQYVKLSTEVIQYLFGMFYLSLLAMLLFSTGIILYTGLFSSREAAFLLTLPASADRIFSFKFVEAISFSSWAFLLLGTPMMVAYGITVGAPTGYYALMPLFLVGFVLIPGAIGAVGAILIARLVPRRRKSVLWVVGALVLVASGFLAMQVSRTPGDVLSRDWLDSLMSKLAFSQHPLLPSRWMSRGILSAAVGQWKDGLFYLGVLVANAAVCYLLAAVVARDLYRPAYGRVHGERSSRRRYGWYGFDAAFHRAFFFVDRPIRLLILKDLRTFRRDPAQWSQFLIFFGLLAFYFLNIRRLGYHVQGDSWRNLLSFMNLAVTALILSTFTTRFIFPLLSLEGRNFWVLGLVPLSRAGILYGKFAFAAGISLIATEALVILSDWMLQLPPMMIFLHTSMVLILCLGLSSISVGMGARLPNLREDDPSKIAAGFGGTLNLLLSLIFILLIVGALALPCHLFLAGRGVNEAAFVVADMPRFRFWMSLSAVAALVVGILGTILPLRIGIRAFERMEL